jgi:cell shape-determining protein MreC
LETTGLDGVFPRGLTVAKVISVLPLEEGSVSFQVRAKSEAENFCHLEYLTILAQQPQEVFHAPALSETISDRIAEEESL